MPIVSSPDTIQMMRDSPIDPQWAVMDTGLTKMPDPMMIPVRRDVAYTKVISFCISTFLSIISDTLEWAERVLYRNWDTSCGFTDLEDKDRFEHEMALGIILLLEVCPWVTEIFDPLTTDVLLLLLLCSMLVSSIQKWCR